MPLETVEIETAREPNAAVIWLHGLGADGHDFEPVVPELVRRGERAWRFVFPHAAPRPVTINGGMHMRAWYDIKSFDRGSAEDEGGVSRERRRRSRTGSPGSRAGDTRRSGRARRVLPGRSGLAVLRAAVSRTVGGGDGPVRLPARARSARRRAGSCQSRHTDFHGTWLGRPRSCRWRWVWSRAIS